MKHTKDNILIARFMEYPEQTPGYFTVVTQERYQFYNCSDGGGDWSDSYRDEELEFHLSWDWIMPVVEKIICNPPDWMESKDWDSWYAKIHDALWLFNIEELHVTVVAFVKGIAAKEARNAMVKKS